jgi:YggT family protein
MSNVAYFVWLIFQILTFAIFFRVILSWFMVTPASTSGFLVTIYHVLFQITEPILAPLRRIIPTIGMFDISPIVAIIVLQVIGEVVVRALS